MKDKQWIIYLLGALVVVLVLGLGGYYYYKKLNKVETTTDTTTEEQAAKETPMNTEVIQNSPKPEGVAEPKYVTPPPPPTL